ncbi:MAG TPA: serine protease [Bryobacteraceae bacterium]|nr:serine protease [Bryobacteraceae bacterium]
MRRVLIIVILLSTLLTFACRHSSAPAGYSRLSAVQVADRAKLATVNINTHIEATVEMAQLNVDFTRLGADSRKKVGTAQPTREQMMSTIYSTLLADPGTYLVSNGKTQRIQTKINGLGSGLVITPDGYVVTNAHVVEPDEDEVKSALVGSLKSLVEADTAELEKGLMSAVPGSSLSDEDRARFQKVLLARHAQTAHVTSIKSEVFAVTGYTGSGDDLNIRRKECKVQKAGKPAPGKDVAICKMEGEDFPTLPLAASLDEGGIRQGADLFVMGFPGVLAFDTSISARSRLEPSLTAGHVSGIREIGDDNWRAIQTDASISPGNSGGPALNDNGRVVGLATFTVEGERTQNLNFVVSVDVVQEFLKALSVTPSQSLFTKRYLEALDAYERQDARRALALFRGLATEHPESSVVRDFVTRLSNGQPIPAVGVQPTAGGRTPAPPDAKSGKAKIVFLGIVGLLAIIIAVVILANRNN